MGRLTGAMKRLLRRKKKQKRQVIRKNDVDEFVIEF
jgi:hypothetical protein